MPSISESFGISILEAMYAKIPVVAFATDAIPELIVHKETGLLAEKHNIERLADSILKLYKNPEMRRELSEKAYDNVISKYSIRNTTRKLEEFYISLIGNEYERELKAGKFYA